MKPKKIVKNLLIIVIVLVFIDQLSKLIACTLLTEDTVILQNVLEFKYIQEGYKIFSNQNISSILVMLVIIVVAVRYIYVEREILAPRTLVFVGLILAGTTSLLIDRLFRGIAYNFISLGGFPDFSLAYVYILFGWILFLIDFIVNSRRGNYIKDKDKK